MKDFVSFIKKQGVVGLAVAFVLGAKIVEVVTALVNDIIQPIVGLLLGKAEGLKEASFSLAGARIMYGDFISVLIDFVIVAAVVYYGVKLLKLETLDLKDKTD